MIFLFDVDKIERIIVEKYFTNAKTCLKPPRRKP